MPVVRDIASWDSNIWITFVCIFTGLFLVFAIAFSCRFIFRHIEHPAIQARKPAFLLSTISAWCLHLVLRPLVAFFILNRADDSFVFRMSIYVMFLWGPMFIVAIKAWLLYYDFQVRAAEREFLYSSALTKNFQKSWFLRHESTVGGPFFSFLYLSLFNLVGLFACSLASRFHGLGAELISVFVVNVIPLIITIILTVQVIRLPHYAHLYSITRELLIYVAIASFAAFVPFLGYNFLGFRLATSLEIVVSQVYLAVLSFVSIYLGVWTAIRNPDVSLYTQKSSSLKIDVVQFSRDKGPKILPQILNWKPALDVFAEFLNYRTRLGELMFFIELWQIKDQGKKVGVSVEDTKNVDLSWVTKGECVLQSENNLIYEQVSYLRSKYLDAGTPLQIEISESSRKEVQYVLHNVFRKRMKQIYKKTTMLYNQKTVEADSQESTCPFFTNFCSSRQSCSWLCDDDNDLDELDRTQSASPRSRKRGWKNKTPDIMIDEIDEDKEALLRIFQACEDEVWRTLLEEFESFATTGEFVRVFKRMIRDGHYKDDELKLQKNSDAKKGLQTQFVTHEPLK